ncbi:hypothetical protein F5X97DRAFT_306904 [Nemania serpens]|nr:hypothetical protein F5X97DRAFT_306904 [Nemania serpens]
MSATSSSTSSAASATPAPACKLYEIPTAEPGCAVSFGEAHQSAMAACCKPADVISYFNDCGLYCAAAGQTVEGLRDCLFDQRVAYPDVFCNAMLDATATDGSPSIPATASASVVVAGNGGGGKGGDGDDGDGNDDDDDARDHDDGNADDEHDDGDGDGDAPKASDSGNAAPRLAPGIGVSKTGLTICALLFSAVAFGAFQV